MWQSAYLFFFFNDTATTEIYTLSLHDALPICAAGGPAGRWRAAAGPGRRGRAWRRRGAGLRGRRRGPGRGGRRDRKSTRLNSSHSQISYAVFCLKKKKTPLERIHTEQPLSLVI